MKSILQNEPFQIATAVLMSGLMTGQTVLAQSVRSANRNSGGRRDANANVNRNANANVNRNANVNVNRNANVNVNRDVNVNVNRHVHIDVDHHHGGFWAGVGTAMLVGAIVRSIPPTRT